MQVYRQIQRRQFFKSNRRTTFADKRTDRDMLDAIEDARVRAVLRGDVFRARTFAETLERHRHRRARQ